MADIGNRSGTSHLVDIEAVAQHLGVSVRHVRRLVFERRIPFIKWGHLLRFDLNEIAAWVDGWRQGGTKQAGTKPVEPRPPAVRRPRAGRSKAR
ncbi:MAG: helix-turn-helix domain-containing protein [Acidimicrobiales bacterium]